MIAGLKRLVRGETNIDFIGRSKIWATISTIVIAVSVIGLLGPGLNLGLEFKGGTALTVPVSKPLPTDAAKTEFVAEVDDALDEFALGELQVQVQTRRGAEGPPNELLVRAKRVEPARLEEVRQALAELAGAPNTGAVNVTDVGPSWGQQVSAKALRGLIVFLVLVSLYISMRFELKMAAGALGALFHDLIATAGIYALVGFEVTPATVIALLTLMGFSLYDTVVVFDRVHENSNLLGANNRLTYGDMVNRSINEVLMRSVNTSISSLLPVGGLLFVGVFLFGADTLKDLALAMFVGTAVSTYSSIFVAAPILAALKEREPRNRAIRARIAGDPGRAAMATAGAPVTVAAEETAASTTTTTGIRAGAPPLHVPRSAPKPRKRKRGKRR